MAGGARIIRMKEVAARTGLNRTTIWRLERAGNFPRRRQLGGGSVGWVESEIDEWIASRPVVGDVP